MIETMQPDFLHARLYLTGRTLYQWCYKNPVTLTVTAYDNSEVHSSPGDAILSPRGVHPVLK